METTIAGLKKGELIIKKNEAITHCYGKKFRLIIERYSI
jgi:hypothetical protein